MLPIASRFVLGGSMRHTGFVPGARPAAPIGLEVDAVLEALVLAAVEVLVDPALPFGGLILGLVNPVSVGVCRACTAWVWRSISRQTRSGTWSRCVVSAAMSWAVRARSPRVAMMFRIRSAASRWVPRRSTCSPSGWACSCSPSPAIRSYR